MLKRFLNIVFSLLLALTVILLPINVGATESIKSVTEFQFTGQFENWIVPTTGTYQIEAWGAQGGENCNIIPDQGGKGARMRGDFSLSSGQSINIIVGEQGKRPNLCNEYNGGSGGGGGSFVWLNGSDLPLIVAGGGGGSGLINHGAPHYLGIDGTTNQDGTLSRSGGTPGTKGGDGNTNSGGRGWNTVKLNPQGLIGMNEYGGNGGFGGGGGGGWAGNGNIQHTAGAGGGYSGGAASTDDYYAGGGGGSFNKGTNQSNDSGVQVGNGFVRITLLDEKPPTLTGVTIGQRAVTIHVGFKYQIVVLAQYSDGTTKDVTNKATYRSSNENVLSVNNAGLVSGINRGSGEVYVTYKERLSTGKTAIYNSRVKIDVH